MSSPSVPEAPDLSPAPSPAASAGTAAGRRTWVGGLARYLGTTLVVLGVAAVAWTIVVWRWQDPFTALYTLYQQHKLAGRYHKIAESYHPLLTKQSKAQLPKVDSPAVIAAERRLVKLDAKRYRSTLQPGKPVGRIKVPRLGLSTMLVAGTDHDSLTKGPGWDARTYLPGSGQLMYIAGHRTTYLAPFAHIDKLRPGDLVTIEVPYGKFIYRVRQHRPHAIVPSDDLSQLKSHNREVVALQACHPRFFATHRYIVYAVPVRVVPKGGKAYAVG
jgi:sortase A